MKKLLLALAVVALVSVLLAVPALAGGPGEDGLGACSDPVHRGGGPGDTHGYVPKAAGNADPAGALLHPTVGVPPGP